jgi:hypothetical protein
MDDITFSNNYWGMDEYNAIAIALPIAEDANTEMLPDTVVNPASNTDAAPKPRKKKAPTLRAHDWEPHRPRFEELYVQQKLPLPEVKRIMEEENRIFAEYVSSNSYKWM